MSSSPLLKLIPLLVALILTGHVAAQPFNGADTDADSLSEYIEMKYSLDQELYNGFQYHERYIQYKGDAFFPENSFYKGSITLRGIQYDDVQLKYDSYAQHLILGYSDYSGNYNQLIIGSIHTDSFLLGTYRFHKLSISGEEPLFYQVLNAGPLTCYIHWKKEIISVNYDFQYSHEFTKPMRNYYMRYMGQLHSFTNRKSFISIFPESLKPLLKKYFRQQQFSFREADPADLQNMLDFVAGRSETNSRQ